MLANWGRPGKEEAMDQMKTWTGNGGEENGRDYNFRAPLSGKPRPDQWAVNRFRRRASQVPALGGAAPPKTDDTSDPLELGSKAWKRLKDNARDSFEDWVLTGKAVFVGKQHALTKSNKARPGGQRYNKEFSAWLKIHGFDDIDKSDRSKLLHIVENLDEIEAWRATLSDGERAKYNHPSTVWRAWECPNRGNKGKPKDSTAEPSAKAEGGYTRCRARRNGKVICSLSPTRR
jgi:hypothetical protein